MTISLQNVSAGYGARLALRNISATIATGALVAVAGPNGAGKSTLLKLIAGVLRLRSGTVEKPALLSYLPQRDAVQRDFPIDALQAVTTGFWPTLGNGGAITAAHCARARAALHEVGLQGLENRQIGELSGGQFQRLLFARVILADAPVILLDEPFTGVDRATVQTLLQLILGWHREGRTVLCVLHDDRLIEKYFPQTLLVDGSGGARLATTHDLIAANLLDGVAA